MGPWPLVGQWGPLVGQWGTLVSQWGPLVYHWVLYIESVVLSGGQYGHLAGQ